MDGGVTSLMCELVASLLAQQLGLSAPEPAIVQLDPAIAQLLPPGEDRVSAMIRSSGGPNFATKVLVGAGIPPVDEPLSVSMRSQAGDVFAFDALTQNPDRRFDNPNLLRVSEQLFLIDHETAFSFLYALTVPTPPWHLEQLDFLERHVFYRSLRGKDIKFDRFAEALEALSDAKIDLIETEIPTEWKNENLEKVLSHIREIRDHAQSFVDQVARRLV